MLGGKESVIDVKPLCCYCNEIEDGFSCKSLNEMVCLDFGCYCCLNDDDCNELGKKSNFLGYS